MQEMLPIIFQTAYFDYQTKRLLAYLEVSQQAWRSRGTFTETKSTRLKIV